MTMIANANKDLQAQADPFSTDADEAPCASAMTKAWSSATSTANPERITEMDALIAYLQMLGTLVDFKSYQPDSAANKR
jgi:cytochrome c oxidase cbb3-type subunit II